MIKIFIACFFVFVTNFSYAQETVYSNDNKQVKSSEAQQGMQNSEVTTYLKDMLKKAEMSGSFHCKELVATTLSETEEPFNKFSDTQKSVIWVKGKFARMEVESASNPTLVGSLMIIHPDWAYGYDKRSGFWLRMPMPSGEAKTTYSNRLIKLLDNPTVRIVGKETIEDKKATVIEYQLGDNIAKTTCKEWIWNEKGVTLKSESNIKSDYTINAIREDYTDYVFEDIPDSLFEVPKDKVIDNPLFQGTTN